MKIKVRMSDVLKYFVVIEQANNLSRYIVDEYYKPLVFKPHDLNLSEEDRVEFIEMAKKAMLS